MLEIRLGSQSLHIQPEISEKTLRIPRWLEWCGRTYEFMGAILVGQQRGGNKRLFNARVVIRGQTYSYHCGGWINGPLNPVEPNLCDRDWSIECNPSSISPSFSLEPIPIRPVRVYYTIMDVGCESHPISQWVDHTKGSKLPADVVDMLHPDIQQPVGTAQKKPRRSSEGKSRKGGQ